MATQKQAQQIAQQRAEQHRLATEHPANRQAMEQLKALVNIPGALKFITNIPNDQYSMLDPREPRYWVCHDVTWLEGPDDKGNVWAFTREGDRCVGHAHAVLGRLTEYSRSSFSFSSEELVIPEPLTKD